MKKTVVSILSLLGCAVALHATSDSSGFSYSSTDAEAQKVIPQKKSAQPSFGKSYASLPLVGSGAEGQHADAEKDRATDAQKTVKIIDSKNILLANEAQYASGNKDTFNEKNDTLQRFRAAYKNSSIKESYGELLYTNYRRLKNNYEAAYDSCGEEKK